MLLDLGSGEWVRVTETDDVVKSPRFSLDGKLLAYVRGNDLYVWEIRTRVERRLTEDGTDTLLNGTVSWVYWEEIFGRNDQGYEWSPDSKSIAYLQTDESGVGLVSFIDFEPNVPEVINQRYPKTGEANPRVHPQNAWRFADELIDANIMFDMMIYPMRKHGIEDDEAQQHLYSTMLEFWDRNLKGVGHQESKQEHTNSR